MTVRYLCTLLTLVGCSSGALLSAEQGPINDTVVITWVSPVPPAGSGTIPAYIKFKAIEQKDSSSSQKLYYTLYMGVRDEIPKVNEVCNITYGYGEISGFVGQGFETVSRGRLVSRYACDNP